VVEIKGIEKFTPKDFPGYISSTVFLGGCNFRCPYCHNSDLVLRAESLPSFPMDYFLSFLDSRKNWLEGVCVSGGEPLLHQDLEAFLSLIKDRDLLVKVDTNGSFPLQLEELIKKNLVDYVAMDVKASLERYQEVAKAKVKTKDILRSIELIINSGLDYIFRTTVVPGLVSSDDVMEIGQMLKGAKIYQIQKFVPKSAIDSYYNQITPFSRQDIQTFAKIAEPYFGEVRVESF
jgi:pyruvate formate lyase activating enzyme